MSSLAVSRRSLAGALGGGALSAPFSNRPNILWITCEDIGPHLGAYGDRYADTPNLDRLAVRSLRYRTCWSNAPVCAPARTAIISGVYPTSTGSEHMRSNVRMAGFMRMYPQILREAGYYASNNVKEDYNLQKPGPVWDDSSNHAHWRNRKSGQPFFSIFNFTITHESQIRKRPHSLVHDPAKVRVPPYHPDAPEVRHDWAQYYDNITTMDGMAGKVLAELDRDGLAGETIVFFFGDHGSGMPRNKRWPYNSGLRVPLIVHVPPKFQRLAPKDYRPGGESRRLVSFVDLAPTVLSLAGLNAPDWMQGQAFLGEHPGREHEFLHGFRGRMDERYDMVRSVRDQRYVYVRNYLPHLIYGQHLAYMFETPTTQVWKRLYDEGKLKPPKTLFWEPKPAEELYDLESDPDEVHNLAGSATHGSALGRLRRAQQEHARRIRDIGFLPEDEIHLRSKGSTPYEVGHDVRRYPMTQIMAAAELASSRKDGVESRLVALLDDPDSAVRFWGVNGILGRGAPAVARTRAALRKALADPAPAVRTVAAQALGEFGQDDDLNAALPVLVQLADCRKNAHFVSVRALNALDALGARVNPAAVAIRALPFGDESVDSRIRDYPERLLKGILNRL